MCFGITPLPSLGDGTTNWSQCLTMYQTPCKWQNTVPCLSKSLLMSLRMYNSGILYSCVISDTVTGCITGCCNFLNRYETRPGAEPIKCWGAGKVSSVKNYVKTQQRPVAKLHLHAKPSGWVLTWLPILDNLPPLNLLSALNQSSVNTKYSLWKISARF